MPDDNGAGMRALFHGLCRYWGYRASEMQVADFLLAHGIQVVITPGPADRQVEVGALRAAHERVLLLNRDDMEALCHCDGAEAFAAMIWHLALDGSHAARARQAAGISP